MTQPSLTIGLGAHEAVNAVYGGDHTAAYRILQAWVLRSENREAVGRIVTVAAALEVQQFEADHGHLPWVDADCEQCR